MTTKHTMLRSALAAAAVTTLSVGLSLPANAVSTNTTSGSAPPQVEVQEFTPIERRYWNEPYLREVLGNPVDTEYDLGEISYQQFQNGWMYHSDSTGVHEVHGAIAAKYVEVGQFDTYGLPTTDELPTPDGVGRFNHFAGTDAIGTASIYWTPATGAQGIWGPPREFWALHGFERGYLGYPTSTTADTPILPGVYTHFVGDGSGASVYWSADTGAHSVQGAIRQRWASLGWENSELGFPVSNEYDVPGGRRSDFQGGYVVWDASTNETRVFYYEE